MQSLYTHQALSGDEKMASVTIRNLDNETVARLKERAKANNRSLEAELRTILGECAGTSKAADLRAHAERIAAMTPDRPQTDSAALLRELRDR
jgi:antitoxin FitA